MIFVHLNFIRQETKIRSSNLFLNKIIKFKIPCNVSNFWNMIRLFPTSYFFFLIENFLNMKEHLFIFMLILYFNILFKIKPYNDIIWGQIMRLSFSCSRDKAEIGTANSMLYVYCIRWWFYNLSPNELSLLSKYQDVFLFFVGLSHSLVGEQSPNGLWARSTPVNFEVIFQASV